MLVILGLLTGGILAGQSLIRASEIRAVISEYKRYVVATNTFRDKYFALAGDMTIATTVWGASTNNGNGDGLLQWPTAANQTGESFQFWNQLSLAGLIEGSYSGTSGPNGSTHQVGGTNAPKSRLSTGVWGVGDFSQLVAWLPYPNMYNADYGNGFLFGVPQGGNSMYPIIKPNEAWNIDTKLDDGKPGTGKIIARYWSTCANATSATDYTADYNLSVSSVECSLHFRQLF